MLKRLKRWRRAKLVQKHIDQYGHQFSYFGTQVRIPETAHNNIKYQLLTDRYERPEGELIHIYLKPDTHVVELGGSLGIVSQHIRATIGPNAKHIIVEADPRLASDLDTMFKGQNATKIVASALAYGSDVIRFVHGMHNAHIGRVAQEGEQIEGRIIEVPTTNIGKLLSMTPDQGARALIADIEGAELDLMKTEGRLVAESFDLILFEFHPVQFEKMSHTENDFFALCEELGLELLVKNGNVAAFTGRR